MALHYSNLGTTIDQQIRNNPMRGRPSSVIGRLLRRVRAIAQHGGFHLKIGITTNPPKRWRESYRNNGWGRMHVLYETSSWENAKRVERRLIEFMGDAGINYRAYSYNLRAGGGGRRPVSSTSYVYIVRAPRYARISVN
ncbi:MAG: GIY-YIG nuclease family protein [Salinarimonas sp.]